MSGSKTSAALALAAALVLAACVAEGKKPVATPPPPEPAQAVAAAAPEPATPEPEFVPLAEETIEEAIAALEPPEPESEPEDDIDDDPGQVMDLDDAALEALLGEPGFRRQELNARVWQYLGESCVLDVYLYSDGAAAPYRVTYYEVRAEAVDGGAERRCFRGLLLARAAG